MKKRFIRVVGIIMIVNMAVLWRIPLNKAAGHSIAISSPTDGQEITEVYMNDREYKLGLVYHPRESVTFAFTITNYDNYYEDYDAFIDDNIDPLLNDLSWGYQVIYYSAQSFLETYGRGTHTFTIRCYHLDVTGSIGLTEGPDPSDDIIWIDGQRYIVFEKSVTFEFYPPLCHFLGFWYEDETVSWKNNILPIHELLLSETYAHYLPGYHYVTGSWSDYTVQEQLSKLDSYEDENDIVVVTFSSHGSDTWGIKATKGLLLHCWLDNQELASALSVLETNKLILIIDCCHAGIFYNNLYYIIYDLEGNPIDVQYLSNKGHFMYSCTSDEASYSGKSHEYDDSWDLETKIKNIDAYFLKYLVYCGFFAGSSTLEAFYTAYNYVISVRGQNDDQHPLQEYSLMEEIILCVP